METAAGSMGLNLKGWRCIVAGIERLNIDLYDATVGGGTVGKTLLAGGAEGAMSLAA